MDVTEAIYTQREVRDYTGQPVDGATINTLLDAAVQAPHSDSDQPLAFAVIQDKALLKRYSEQARAVLLHQPKFADVDPRLRETISAPDFDIFYDAGTLIIIWAKPGTGGEHSAWDCYFAAHNLMLAAHHRRLGTCPIGLAWSVLETPEARQELDIPADFMLVLPIVVGYPSGAALPVLRQQPEILCWR